MMKYQRRKLGNLGQRFAGRCGRVSGLLPLLIAHVASPLMAQTERTIGFGQNLTGSFCAKTDSFLFTADANDFVVIHVVELSDLGGRCVTACLCFDQLIQLRDADDNLLVENSSPTDHNRGIFHRTQIGPHELVETGTYTVSVRDKQNNGGGDYSVFLQRVNAPELFDSIHSGDTHLSTLNEGEVATFQFAAQPGDRATIKMTAAEIGDVKPRIELYDIAGQALALPNTGTASVVLNDGGLFTLLAFSEMAESGSYRLSFEIELCQSNIDCPHLPCTTATCDVQTGRCGQTVNSGSCLIDGLCVQNGGFHPRNECAVCNARTDTLRWTSAPSGTPCGDQAADACTSPDTCHAGTCLANDIVCDDGDACTGIETCDTVGGCQAGAPLNCDDGDTCTGIETCDTVGGCQAGAPKNCDDGDARTTDSCNSATGCVHTDNTAPREGDAAETCVDGQCIDRDCLGPELCGAGCGASVVGLVFLCLVSLRLIGSSRRMRKTDDLGRET